MPGAVFEAGVIFTQRNVQVLLGLRTLSLTAEYRWLRGSKQ